MAIDVAAAASVVVALSLGAFRGGRSVGLRGSSPLRTAGVSASLLAIVLQLLLRDSLVWARLLPFPAVALLGQAVLVPAGFLAGLVWALLRAARGRRLLTVPPLLLVAAYLTFSPLLGSAPRCGDSWAEGICLQTSDASCSAACAATLLAQHGIRASEDEMAALCLTRRQGTPLLGLYRGLWLKTRGTPWRPAVLCEARPRPPSALPTPVILSVGLNRREQADPRYERDWGWVRGRRHAVLLLALPPRGSLTVADPSVGPEPWPREALDVLWHGEAVYLVPRR